MRNLGHLAVCLAPALALSGCTTVELANQTFTVELGADVYANPRLYLKDEDSIDISKASVVALTPGVAKTSNRFVSKDSDYLNIGEYDFVLEYKGNEYPFVIKVKDTKPPTCQKNPTSIEATLGENIDWEEVFAATDISGVYYEAPSDATSYAGINTITVRVYDRFGNSAEKTIDVVIE